MSPAYSDGFESNGPTLWIERCMRDRQIHVVEIKSALYHGTHTWAGIHADWQYLDHGEREVFPCSQILHCYRGSWRELDYTYTPCGKNYEKRLSHGGDFNVRRRNEICYCSCSGFGFLLHAQLAHGINVFWLITHSQRDINLGQGGQKVGLLNPVFSVPGSPI